MKKREIYDLKKKTRISNLENLLIDENISLENQYYIINKIIDENEFYSFDDALKWIEKNLIIAQKINNKSLINDSKLQLAKLLVLSGRYKESLDIANQLDPKELQGELLTKYYFVFKEGYNQLNFYSTFEKNKELYSRLYSAFKDSLMNRLESSSEGFLRLEEKKYRDERAIEKAMSINNKRLKNASMGTRLYSLITFERSLLYRLNDNINKQKEYLILSSISDIKASVKDNASLSTLSAILFKEGDIDRAHNFISFSVEDAEFYNSSLRFINISNVLPVINKAFEEKIEIQKSKLTSFLAIISVLGIILFASLLFINKQVKRLSKTRKELKSSNKELEKLNKELNLKNEDLKRIYHELSESDKIKEQYIGTFLNLYSEYIDKLDVYRKTVTKHLITNKTKDLLELTKSKHVINTELNLFYTNFDKSFLHIYPSFTLKVNKLLQNDKKIKLDEGELLNTEFRILALIRLGITDSSKISKILRYSVNTIYNYKVKMRNAAIDRENFESNIQKIT